MKEKSRLKHQKGFTLIELMIALLVATLAIGGYIASNIVIQRNADSAFERTVALQDANQIIERMRSIAQSGTFPANVTAAFPQNSTVSGFLNLTNEQVTVSYADPAVNPLDATVTVVWTSHTQRQETTALRTYITQR